MQLNCIRIFTIAIITVYVMGNNQTIISYYDSIEVDELEAVVELDDMNITEFNRTNKFYFLEFYASWCIRCNELIPIYKMAAEMARKNQIPVKFAKIDAIKYHKLANDYKIKGYPTIFWIDNERGRMLNYAINSKPNENSEQEKAQDFVDYATNALENRLFTNVNSYREIYNLNIELNSLLIACEDESCLDKYHFQITNLLNAAPDNFYEKFLFTTSQEIRQKYNLTDELNLLSFLVSKRTDFIDEGEKIDFDIFIDLHSAETAKKLLSHYVNDLYGPIAQYELESIIERGDPSLILFYANETSEEDLERVDIIMRELAVKYRKFLHIYNSHLNSNETFVLKEIYGFTQKQMPLLFISNLKENAIHFNSDELNKYKLENALLTKENIELFINNWQKGILVPFIASEPIPENPYDEDGILKVVGKTFEDFISTPRDLVLTICSDLVERCRTFDKRLKRVAKKLKNNPILLISRTDPTLNDFSVLIKHLFPSIYLFPCDNNNLSAEERFANKIVFDGDLTTRNITDFISQNVKYPVLIDILEDEDRINEEEIKDIIEANFEVERKIPFEIADFIEEKLEEKLKNKDMAKMLSKLLMLDELRAANYSADIFKNKTLSNDSEIINEKDENKVINENTDPEIIKENSEIDNPEVETSEYIIKKDL